MELISPSPQNTQEYFEGQQSAEENSVLYKDYNKDVFTYGLRPLTRDGAASLNHGCYLWGVTEQAHKETFFRDWDDLYD